MSLPQELIDTIIDILEDDVESLHKCTLVSSAFLTRAQQHLFRQITLSSSHTTLPARLANLLSESPHISRAITSLRVVQKTRKRTIKGSKASSWLHIDSSLTDALPSIREFSLECADWASWSSFPSVTKSAFRSLFASGTLVRLTLDSISDVPYQLLECVPTLQELHLNNAAFDIPDTFDELQLPQALPLKKANLTQLHISGHVFEPIQPFVEWMLTSRSCLDLSGLQHFTLLIPYDCGAMLADQVDVINRVVEMCSHSLKELNIVPSLGDLDHVNQGSKIPLQLPDLPQLHTLHLPLEISDYELPECNPNIIWFKALLDTIQTCSATQLRSLDIRCNVVQGNPVMAFDPSYWKNIDAMLAVSCLRSLQSVKLTLKPIYSDVENENRSREFGRMIQQELRVINGRGIFSFDVAPVISQLNAY